MRSRRRCPVTTCRRQASNLLACVADGNVLWAPNELLCCRRSSYSWRCWIWKRLILYRYFLSDTSCTLFVHTFCLSFLQRPGAVPQYRPADLWREEEFVITRVKRDRAWWSRAFPLMERFYQRWQDTKASGAPPPPTVVRRAGHPRDKTLQTSHVTTRACPFKVGSLSADVEEFVLDQIATGACPFKL